MRLTADGFEATRTLLATWTDAMELARRLKGGAYSAGGSVVYIEPHVFSMFPSAIVDSVSIVPFDEKPIAGIDTKTATYNMAELTVEYKTQQYGTGSGGSGGSGQSDPYVSERIEPSTEFLTVSNQKLYWSDDQTNAADESESPQLQLRSFNWIYTRHHISEIPDANFLLVGTVNEFDVTSKRLGFTFNAETLLYGNPSFTRETSATGEGSWTMELPFSYREGGWNKFFRQGYADPQTLYLPDGSRYQPYTLSNFSQLVG